MLSILCYVVAYQAASTADFDRAIADTRKYARELYAPAKQVADKNAARLVALRKLNELTAKFYSREQRDLFIRQVVESIPPPPAGTPESAVYNLHFCASGAAWQGDKPDFYERNVRQLGEKALPALIDALDWDRPTLNIALAQMNTSDQVVPVAWLADDIVRDLAKGDLGTSTRITSAKASAWYSAKRSGRVNQWLLDSIMETRSWQRQGFREIDTGTFEAIAFRHPDLAVKAVTGVLEASPRVSCEIALMIINSSSMTVRKKVAAIDVAARSRDLRQRDLALGYLWQLDRALLDRHLLEVYRMEPTRTPDLCDGPEGFLWLLPTTRNTAVWKAAEQLIPKMDILDQMYALDWLHWEAQGSPPSTSDLSLPILQKYFDDVRKPKTLPTFAWIWEGIHGPWSVGQVALDTAARLLGFASDHNPKRTEVEWKQLRIRVDAALGSRAGRRAG